MFSGRNKKNISIFSDEKSALSVAMRMLQYSCHNKCLGHKKSENPSFFFYNLLKSPQVWMDEISSTVPDRDLQFYITRCPTVFFLFLCKLRCRGYLSKWLSKVLLMSIYNIYVFHGNNQKYFLCYKKHLIYSHENFSKFQCVQ